MKWTLCSSSRQFIRYMRSVSFDAKQQESRLSKHMIKLHCIVQGPLNTALHWEHIKQNFNHVILRLINQLCFFFLGILTLLLSRQWLLNVICNRRTWCICPPLWGEHDPSWGKAHFYDDNNNKNKTCLGELICECSLVGNPSQRAFCFWTSLNRPPTNYAV